MIPWLDTSVLASLYVPEARSAQVARLVRRWAAPIAFSAIHELELTNALRLRVFRKEAPSRLVDATLACVAEDVREGVLRAVAIDWSLAFVAATELAKGHTSRLGARALDLLHVAAAGVAGTSRFVTADRRQGTTARRAGLPMTVLA